MPLVHSASTPGTVVASLARTLLAGAARSGVQSAALLRQVDLNEQKLIGSHARIPYAAWTQLWQSAAEQSGDPAFGIHLAQSSVDVKSFGVVAELAARCATLADALQPVAAFSALINDTTRTTLERRTDSLVIADGHSDRRAHWPRHMAEALLASYLVLGRHWCRTRWVPAEVHFQHEPPEDLRELRGLFGCPLHFRQTENRIILSQAVLALPFPAASSKCAERLTALSQRLLGQRGAPHRFADAVRGAVHAELPLQMPDVDSVARRLRVSTRTLQRRLREEGTAYSELLDDVRHETALALLREPDLPLAAVSAALQFAEPRAFRRAFQRWAGTSPSRFRLAVIAPGRELLANGNDVAQGDCAGRDSETRD